MLLPLSLHISKSIFSLVNLSIVRIFYTPNYQNIRGWMFSFIQISLLNSSGEGLIMGCGGREVWSSRAGGIQSTKPQPLLRRTCMGP